MGNVNSDSDVDTTEVKPSSGDTQLEYHGSYLTEKPNKPTKEKNKSNSAQSTVMAMQKVDFETLKLAEQMAERNKIPTEQD